MIINMSIHVLIVTMVLVTVVVVILIVIVVIMLSVSVPLATLMLISLCNGSLPCECVVLVNKHVSEVVRIITVIAECFFVHVDDVLVTMTTYPLRSLVDLSSLIRYH